jgi:hypothetical protein
MSQLTGGVLFMTYLLICDVIFWVLATWFCICVFSKYKYFLFFFTSRFLSYFLVGLCSLFYAWKDWSASGFRLSLGVCWVGLLLGCLPHRQRWVATPRSGLTAWYVRRETQTVTYPAKGAHDMSRPQEKRQQKCPIWVRVKCVLTTFWAFVPRFLQPFTTLPEGRTVTSHP